MADKEPLMTSKEVAEYLQIDRQTVVKLAVEGRLPGTKLLRVWRFRKSDIDAMIDADIEKQMALSK